MEILIFIIVIGIVIFKLRPKNQDQKQRTVSDLNSQAKQRNQQVNHQQFDRNQQQINYRQSSQQAKAKTAHQKQQNAPQSGIKNKANNVAVNAANELREDDPMLHGLAAANKQVITGLDTNKLMDKVNDLIVTGYSGELTFSRDFIAEGVDMLNRIQDSEEK